MSFRRPVFKVVINGTDVSTRFAPRLKTITVTKNSKRAAHTAEIVVADPDGTTFFPPDGAKVQIALGHVGTGSGVVFEGTVNDVEHRGSKGGGREITISATSADQKGKSKQPALRHKDNATLKDVAAEWGKKAGLNVTVSGALASIQRPYWSMQNESFQAWGQRIAEEVGATFLIEGDRAILAPRNESTSASGKALTPISARFADDGNLINWKISPIMGRPQYQNVEVRYYDTKEARWKTERRDVRSTDAQVRLTEMLPASTQAVAGNRAQSSAKKSEREKGSGTVELLGDYAAEPEAPVRVSGLHPALDGNYIADAVTHSLSKGDGYRTKVSIKLPPSGAGADKRR